MTSNTEKLMTKTFWQKPEGTTGKIVLAAGAVGGGLLVFKYLPVLMAWLVMVLENAVYATALGIALVVLTAPIWNSRVRALTGYMARSVLRAITSFWTTIDPIGILENYVEDLKKNLLKLDAQIGNLRGHIQRLLGLISQNAAEQDKSLKLVGQAQKQGSKSAKAAMQLNARKAGRLKQSNMTLQAMLNKMQALDALLSKLRETSDFVVQDMEDEVKVKKQEREAIGAAYGAFTTAVKVLKGDPDKRALFDQAMEYLAEDYAKKVGEIEDFMRVSEGFITSVDLENGIFEEDALEELNKKLDARTEQLLLGPVERRAFVSATVEGQEVLVSASSAKASDVEQLFNKK